MQTHAQYRDTTTGSVTLSELPYPLQASMGPSVEWGEAFLSHPTDIRLLEITGGSPWHGALSRFSLFLAFLIPLPLPFLASHLIEFQVCEWVTVEGRGN